MVCFILKIIIFASSYLPNSSVSDSALKWSVLTALFCQMSLLVRVLIHGASDRCIGNILAGKKLGFAVVCV